MANDDLELLQNFIHDLKAPLGSAKSFVDLITASGELNESQKHFAHRALANIDKTFGIINALLEFARMEAGATLDVVACDVLESVESIVEMLEVVASEKQITLLVDVHPDAQFVKADEALLEHILMNLMTNAIKYNRIGGTVTVTTETEDGYVRIKVHDTGLGIPENEVGRIFERFYRVNSKEHMVVDGTGIGLAMVKTAIEKHGGQISVDSKLDEGSTFSFTLPRATASATNYNREPQDALDDQVQEAQDDVNESDAGEAPR